MAVHTNEGKIVVTDLLGLEQRQGKCDPQHVLDCLNVEFQNGFVQRRKGRQILMNSNLVKPTNIQFYNGTTYSDVTALLTDGDTTSPGLAGVFAVNTAINIGCPFRFSGVQFFLNTFAPANGVVALNVNARGLPPLGGVVGQTITDGTAVGGNTMKQNGIVAISNVGTIYQSEVTNSSSSWTTGLTQSGTNIYQPQELYWLQIFVAGGIGAGVNVAEIAVTLADGGGRSFRTESNGMAEFTTKNGSRLLVTTNDVPGVLNSYSPSSSFTPSVPSESKVTYVDLGRMIQSGINLPLQIRNGGTPGQRVSYVTFNGWLLGTTGAGYIWKFDGTTCSVLEPKAGLDLQNNVVGAQAYLTQVPRGTMLEVFQSRLMVAGDPSAPLSFHASMFDNNISVIPPDATVGGPNVWPMATSFLGLPSRDGDYITGTSVINNLYVIFTRSRTFTWDGNVTITNTNADVGCVATGSIQRTNNSVFFLSDDGFYQTDGINIMPVSESIWKILHQYINWSSIQNATSAYDKTRAEYKCWLPINGEPQNQFCVVYNIKTNTWRFAAGWYPWDTNARRDANSVVQSVSAACTVTGADGRKMVVTSDADGALWQEEIGRDDNGIVFPAFISLPPMSSQGKAGEDYINLREWYINLTMDGQWIECYSLGDGDRFDQELDRRFANVATKSEVVQKQADTDNSPATEIQYQYANVPGWPVDLNFAKPKKLKFSFGRNLSKMQPIIHWTPGQFLAGTYTTSQVSGLGQIFDIQFGVSPKGDGR